jgi:hypothetical protein
MTSRRLSLIAAAMLLAVTGSAAPSIGEAQTQSGRVVIQERIMIRIPAGLQGAGFATPAQVRWKEKKGVKCVPARSIAGATLVSQNSVDLILRDRSRVRAKLENDCPALDYYHGFYVTPTADGMICADRDRIRSRMGGECEIDRFRTLEPVRAD